MGVTSLWTVVQPCARPIKIETLNRKRLAVDASIWIYQFLKAVRDKEGNALRNSHVVGFFQRICKLLFIGIKPVFVFDGGAPALKRQTINARKSRREGRREDAVRTAGKLLALQMQRRAEEEDQRRRDEAQGRRAIVEEEEIPENLVYVDELQMTQQERMQNRTFRKKDAYHLPALDASLAEMGQPNDPRVMSLEDLEQYARQFDTAEDINVYDFSKIDFDGAFFLSLPASDRYNILNAARLRSRLRMGLSKDQLDTMFPDRMAFSRFQIERVRERNELTQRLMHLNGMVDDAMFGVNGTGRVAGEKGREYVLVRNAGVEGGWALGVIGDKDQGERNKPIDVDEVSKPVVQDLDEDGWEEDEDTFEDVPIEGLNRLPKRTIPSRNHTSPSNGSSARYRQQRAPRATAPARQVHTQPQDDPDSLFVPDASQSVIEPEDDEDDLERAIAMSLEQDEADQWEDVLDTGTRPDLSTHRQQKSSNAGQVQSRPKGGAPATSMFNDSDDDMDYESLAESRRPTADNRFAGRLARREEKPIEEQSENRKEQSTASHQFEGPLPFESLDLGSSILGKKKMKQLTEDAAGGFEKPGEKRKAKAVPIPPWFSGDVEEGLSAQNERQAQEWEETRRAEEDAQYEFDSAPQVIKAPGTEVIDVDVDVEDHDANKVINLESPRSEPDEAPEEAPTQDIVHLSNEITGPESPPSEGITAEDDKDANLTVGDLAEDVQANPPQSDLPATSVPSPMAIQDLQASLEKSDDEVYEWEESDAEREETSDEPMRPSVPNSPTRSESPEFENVEIPVASPPVQEIPVADDIDESYLITDGDPGDEDQGYESAEQDYFSDPEEDELMHQMAIEAEEHARFASTFNNKTQRQNIEDYERELKALRIQQQKDRRDADEVTQVMITECQQLLKYFGLPYITAPMEAEAQCAELVQLGLVDGIVTDDSDIFLFGGTRVYKNMFNQAKFVECYLTNDLEREFDLTREKLIDIAHLLGSDYTEGLPGIGPVTALEILSDFPSLNEFKDWWTKVQTGARASTEDMASPFRRKFRKNSTKLFLPPAFPDQRVAAAYLEPDVDRDPSPFQWGIPDLDALREFLMATIGWSPSRTDEVLVPVIRDMNRRENEGTQANITSFVTGGSGTGIASARGAAFAGSGDSSNVFAPRRRTEMKSRRMEVALEKMAARARERRSNGTAGSVAATGLASTDAEGPSPSKARAKDIGNGKAKVTSKAKKRAAASADGTETHGHSDDDQDASEAEFRPTRKARKTRRAKA